MSVLEELVVAAKRLMDTVNYDMIGDPITKGGNGGLISRETMRASDELRRVLHRAQKTINEQRDPA